MPTTEHPGDYLYKATQLWRAGDTRGALQHYLMAAEAGDVDGQVNAGYCYETGTGTRRSRSQALRWYRAAVAQRSGAAAFNIATMRREHGNARGAAHWFTRAAGLGDDTANLELGRLYLERYKQTRRALVRLRHAVRGRFLAPDSLAEARGLIVRLRRLPSDSVC